jgi:hypothetical protein
MLNLSKENNLKYIFRTLSKNTPIPVGEKISLITVLNSEESIKNHNNANALITKLSFTLTYNSMYKEKFKLNHPVIERKKLLTKIKIALKI